MSRLVAEFLAHAAAESATRVLTGGCVELGRGVPALLARLAAERPTLLVLQDTHWADRSSLDLLDFLVRNQQAAPGSPVAVTIPGRRSAGAVSAGGRAPRR